MLSLTYGASPAVYYYYYYYYYFGLEICPLYRLILFNYYPFLMPIKYGRDLPINYLCRISMETVAEKYSWLAVKFV